MCKEGDDEKPQKEPLVLIIPDGLPQKSSPIEVPANIIATPKHHVDDPAQQNPSAMSRFEDLPLSDVNEDTRAR